MFSLLQKGFIINTAKSHKKMLGRYVQFYAKKKIKLLKNHVMFIVIKKFEKIKN